MGSSLRRARFRIGRPRQTHSQTPHCFCRSDLAAISSITTAANGGLALIGGWYVYMTVPYVYVAPIIELGSICTLELKQLLSYGGPGECEGNNYDDETKSCKSDKTIKDTMGDQGLAGMCDNAGLWAFRHPWPELACPRLQGCEAWASFALTCAWRGGGRGSFVALPVARWL